MLSKTETKQLLEHKFPGSKVESGIFFQGQWVFRVFLPIGGGEEKMNPFIAVNQTTGETKDFSPIACGDMVGFMNLFAKEDG